MQRQNNGNLYTKIVEMKNGNKMEITIEKDHEFYFLGYKPLYKPQGIKILNHVPYFFDLEIAKRYADHYFNEYINN